MPCSKIIFQHCVPDNARAGHSKVPGHQCCSMAVMEVTIHFNNINKIFIKKSIFWISCCLVFFCPFTPATTPCCATEKRPTCAMDSLTRAGSRSIWSGTWPLERRQDSWHRYFRWRQDLVIISLGVQPTKQRMVFRMIHVKDSLLPMGKVWSAWTSWDFIHSLKLTANAPENEWLEYDPFLLGFDLFSSGQMVHNISPT